jgi:hypothetical protein
MPKLLRLLIAGLELTGGVCGLVILVKQLPTFRIDAHVIILSPIAIGIFLMSFIAGMLLWVDHRAGRITSIIVQFLQLPKLASPLLIFMFSFGFDFYPYVVAARGVSKVETDFKLLAFYNLYLNRPGFPFAFGISIPAIVFLIVLIRHRPVDSPEKTPPPPPTISEWNGSTKTRKRVQAGNNNTIENRER